MVYVVNNGSNSFTPIIIVTNTAGTAISVGSGPNGIAITPNGQTVFVSHSGDSDVTPIATYSNTAGVTISAEPFCNGFGHDGMVGVEIVVAELIAHSGDRSPGNLGLLLGQLGVKVLDGLADLDQPSPAGLSDDALVEASLSQVPRDGLDRSEHIGQPGDISPAHNVSASASTSARRNGRRDDSVPTSTRTFS